VCPSVYTYNTHVCIAFSCGFFNALAPAANAYYNKEANLICLRCAKHKHKKSIANAKIQYFKLKQEYLYSLQEHKMTLTGKVQDEFCTSC
jgi:hypothetical protein